MGKIELNGMKFYGYHGCCDTEKLAGGRYIVDFSGEYDSGKAELSDDLKDAVDYSKVYSIVAKCMSERKNLLESLCNTIASGIKKEMPEFKNVCIKITKLNPPLPGVVDSSSFTCSL